MEAEIAVMWDRLRELAGPYPPRAFAFVQEGLRATCERLHEAGHVAADDTFEIGEPESRHVSGQELCFGLRDFAIDQYGHLARTVLASWNIVRTEDFGRIVFAMVEAELLRKTDEDSLEDFQGVYEFAEVFDGAPLEC